MGERVNQTRGLLRGVDLQEVADVADRALRRAQADAVADHPRRQAVVADAGDFVNRAVHRFERHVALVRADGVDAEVARGFLELDVAVGEGVDIAAAEHVGVGAHVDGRVGDVRMRRHDHDVAAGVELAEVISRGDRRRLAGVGIDRWIKLRRRPGVGTEVVHVRGAVRHRLLRGREGNTLDAAEWIGLL